MKIVLANDIHAADRPPSSCTDTYCQDILDLVSQVAVVAKNFRAGAVVWAGDVFHHKAPSRTSHQLVQALIKLIDLHSCPVYIVPGNHDLLHDRLESVHVTQPLGVLLRSGARLLDGWATSGFPGVGGFPLYGVPWLQGYGSPAEMDDRVAAALAAFREDNPFNCLVVTHAPLYPPGQELPYEHYPAEKWASAMGGEGNQCWYGHVHERHGIWEAGGVTFANFGALSRGSLHEYNLARKVSCGVWDSEAGTFAEVRLNARPAAEVFRLTEKAQAADIAGRLDEFLEAAGSAILKVVSAEEVMALVRSRGLGKDVEALAEELLAQQAGGERT